MQQVVCHYDGAQPAQMPEEAQLTALATPESELYEMDTGVGE